MELLSAQIAIQIILALISFIGLFLSFNATLETKFNSLRLELKADIKELGEKIEKQSINQARTEQKLDHFEQRLENRELALKKA